MNTQSAQVTSIKDWKRENKLEAGRNEVLREAARGADLSKILNLLCEKSEEYNPDMKSSVLLLNEENSTLHPMASVSLPDAYCQALDGVTIGIGVGSCGTAAFSKERVIVEDINTHPYWAQYKELALGAGLQACWSEPIIGADGKVFGTFAMYYETPKKPTHDDINFIETSANLAAVVFESGLARQKLVDANAKLNQTVDERNQQLQEANKELSIYLE
jgi:GAF domain-containing protein